MWAVSAPTLSVTDSANACAQGVREKVLKAKVKAAVDDFASNSVILQANIHAQLLHDTLTVGYSVTDLTDDELRWLYDAQLARQGSKARHVYDHVKGNALHELCSYCQYGIANTIDHFIPVSVVHELSIDPWNLVPACDRCNKLLLDKFAATEDRQMLHPYALPASVPPTARWLRARVLQGPAAVVQFYADPDGSLAGPVANRIVNQFELLELGTLYRVVSARELAGTCRSLAVRFPGGQEHLVAAHLRELSDEAFAGEPNDRRGAMYEALAADDWFTSIGYELTP